MTEVELTSRVKEALEGFSGTMRLFPLPDLVMFPLTVIPLHVFELRYRRMLRDAQDGDRYLGIVLLEEGSESNYHGTPPIHTVACLGRVIQEEILPNGESKILLEGLARARIEDELQSDPFRVAAVSLLDEEIATAQEDADWRRRFHYLTTGSLAMSQPALGKAVGTLLGSRLPIGAVADIVAAGLPLPPRDKQSVLEELVAPRRASMVLGMLADLLSRGSGTAPVPS